MNFKIHALIKIVFFVALPFLNSKDAYCYNVNKHELLEKCAKAQSIEDLENLYELANYYLNIEGENSLADSTVNVAIDIAENESDKEWLILTYHAYSKFCLPENYSVAESYLSKATIFADKLDKDELKFLTIIASAELKLKEKKEEEGIREVLPSKNLINENNKRNFLYHITLGNLFNETLDIHSTFENYNSALEFAYELNNDSLIFLSQLKLIEFTLKNKLYSKTPEYISKCKELIANNLKFSDYDRFYLESLELEWLANTNSVSIAKKGRDLLLKINKKDYKILEENIYRVLRLSFMKNDDIQSLSALYNDPINAKHFKRIQLNSPELYFRIKAYITENSNNIDSALAFWKQSESLLINNSNYTYLSNFYIRFGQFYVRQNMKQAAVEAFKHAYEFALKSNFLPMVIESSSRLDSAYYAVGDIQNAYIALRNNKIFIDSNTKLLQQEKLTIMEQSSEKRLESITERIAKEAEERSNRFQLYLIGFFVIALITFLVFLSKKSISASTLKMFGYITFVFLFEFFIFLLHNVFHSITHSPIWLMLMNVTLIALLLPLHHATEHRVLHFLMKKNRVEHKNESLFPVIKGLIQKYRNWLAVKDEDHDEIADAKH